MQSVFAGAFRCEGATDADDGTRSWECPICWTANEAADDDAAPSRCKSCQRRRSPEWLLLEQHELQISLGSRALHTSPAGSKSVSVIVAINHVQKIVTLLRMKVKHAENDNRDHRGAVSFHEVVLSASQVQEQVRPLDAEQDDTSLLDKYGICGECRGVFHVEQGDPQSQYANEDKIADIRKELVQLGTQKQRLVREKAYERVLEYTEQIKCRTKQLQFAEREIELLNPIFCPFCGWVSSKQ